MIYTRTMPANAHRFYEQVTDDALHLPPVERSMLIEKLQNSLKEDKSLSQDWIDEVGSRAADIDSGRVILLDGDECMKAFHAI